MEVIVTTWKASCSFPRFTSPRCT